MSNEKKAVLIQFPTERMARDFLGEAEFPESVTARLFSEKELASFYISIAKIRGEIVEQDKLPNEIALTQAIHGIEYAEACLTEVLKQISIIETKKRMPT
ncbi:hypothetical protein KA005_74270 [bacterium]|nr:hypothetical protein [bacterium]